MKPTLILSLFTGFLFIEGCSTIPLDIESHGRKLEPTFDFEHSDIQFLSYCLFNTAPKYEFEGFVPNKGIVALTDTELFLVNGDLETVQSKHVRRIPITEIEGISIMPRELQIKHGELYYVVVLYRWIDLKVDRKKLWEFHELLASKNIDQFEGVQEYSAYGSRIRRSDTGDKLGTVKDGREHIYEPYERFPVHNR